MLKHENRDKWEAWLDRIMDEMLASAIDQRVFQRWWEVVHANKAIDTNNRLMGLLWGSYMERQALTIRRQLDRNSKAISFAKLMEDLALHAAELTREDFLNAYTRPEYTDTWAQGEQFFAMFADPSAPHVLSAEVVRGHVEELRAASAVFLEYADKWLAHSDRGRSWPALSFESLNACLNLLYRRWEQYRELVNTSPVDADIERLTGTDWEEILNIPWRAQSGTPEVQ